MSTIISKYKNIPGFSAEAEFIINRYSTNLLDSSQIGTKRIFDVVFSIFFILFIAVWLFPLIALAIRMESKGPVIFKQMRHGKNNVPFFCYKFRSMKFSPNGHFKQASKNDPRITRVGLFLRKTSIDELPQIINVLMGQMSIVGPRPHAITMNKEFADKIQYFMCRHMVKPGITGLAQAKGFRGEIMDEFDINTRLKYDLFYIKNWSVFLDFKVMFLTVKCLLANNDNAY
ncbi:hypothetical protein P872_14035 [Rhodonellum psychrophilum GCM71 = DSM 17998]|uniref:Bacterial sugar transferase domain-containing protein n=2 Tax=Rhodonellum TaxID=336827 RepID=U5BRN0_9BACT|nr:MULTISPECIES: sugar transferase [Rhodonellum]ERM80179.1 hypothetical protein P872_14035 [Rhodonellum psychrophilum GCM71 = DSM 17998]SDZ41384.1 putative colanic acid biosysnthesis UDP-glucose lipid carrier transferase [Rhodonellum ikkaensis]